MPQLHLYVTDEVAAAVRRRATARGLSVSRYLAELVTRDVDRGWPEGFFEDVAGAWGDQDIDRPSQGEYEERERLP